MIIELIEVGFLWESRAEVVREVWMAAGGVGARRGPRGDGAGNGGLSCSRPGGAGDGKVAARGEDRQ